MNHSKQQESVFYRNPDFDHPIIDHADGVELFDSEGNRFLDFGAGIGVVNIGYRVPEVLDAAYEQMKKTSFVYTPVFSSPSPLIKSAYKPLLYAYGECRLLHHVFVSIV